MFLNAIGRRENEAERDDVSPSTRRNQIPVDREQRFLIRKILATRMDILASSISTHGPDITCVLIFVERNPTTSKTR